MFEIDESKNRIVIKENKMFLVIVIFAAIMSVLGIRVIIGLLPFDDFSDVFGFIFLCIWTLTVLGMGIFSLITGSKQVIIDEAGVLSKTLVSENKYNWDEIKDYGLSYCGQSRGQGNTYYLYFSKEQQPIKNECKKKLKGKMIKTFVFESDYEEVVQKIIPFCISHTEVQPFIGKDKFHFL